MLDVYLQDVKVGALERFEDEYETHVLALDRAYLSMPDRPVLGQLFEDRLLERMETHGLTPWFEHLLPPPNRPLRRAVARDAGIEDADDGFALLAWLGDDLLGAVRLRVADGAALQRRRSRRPVAEVTEGRPYRVSLPGAQWKLSLVEGVNGLTLPMKGQHGEWIAKFHTDIFQGIVRVERATMRWAELSGIRVPETRIITVDQIEGLPPDVPRGDGQVYLIRRFDRTEGGGRVHSEDFGQILDLPVGERQFAARYEHIAKVLSALCPLEDLREFVRQLVFCVLAGNGDAHVKNWSVTYPDGRHPRLSPAYDLVPTILIEGETHALALSLASNRTFSNINRASFAPMARIVGLDEKALVTWAVEDAARIRDAWLHADLRELYTPTERSRIERHMNSIPLR